MCLARMLTPQGLRELAEVAERDPRSRLDAERLRCLADRMQLAGEGARPDGTFYLSGASGRGEPLDWDREASDLLAGR